MRSFKFVSRGILTVALAAGIASAQLLNSKSLDVIRVEKTGISAGKIDSLAKMLGEQQFRGKKIDDQTMTQLRYAVISSRPSSRAKMPSRRNSRSLTPLWPSSVKRLKTS